MKSKLLEFLTSLQTGIAAVKEKANQALAGMPPLEQIEQGNKVLGAINQINWIKDDLQRLSEDERFTKLDDMILAAATELSTETVQNRITAGELISQADLEARLETARQAGRDEILAAQRDQETKNQLIASRREEVRVAFGDIIAAAMEVSVLEADNFADILAAAIPLRDKAAADGFTADTMPAAFKQLVLAAFVSEAAFTPLLASLLEIKNAKAPATGKTTVLAGAQPVIPAKTDGSSKPSLAIVSPY